VNHYALFYTVVDDFVARRAAYRSEHLRLAQEAHKRGEIVLAGALAEPVDRALLVFRVVDRSAGEEFERAVVADEAAALLEQFDDRVRHYEIVLDDGA
jgi:hypothetical protein